MRILKLGKRKIAKESTGKMKKRLTGREKLRKERHMGRMNETKIKKRKYKGNKGKIG